MALVPAPTSVTNGSGDMGDETVMSPVSNMIAMLRSGSGQDVQFIVSKDKVTIKAHKLILATHSAFFHDLFQKDSSSIVSIAEDEYASTELRLFLEYVYGGHGVTSIKDAFPLLNLAIKYGVGHIMKQCAELLKKGITVDTAFATFEQSRKYGDPSLHEKALEHICRNAFKMLDSCPDFVELSLENVKQIICRDDLMVFDELQVYNAVIRWGKAAMEREKTPQTEKYLCSMLEGLVGFIRFPLMDKDKFFINVLYGDMRILTSEQAQEMRDYFCLDKGQRDKLQLRIFSKVARADPCPSGKKEYFVNRLQQVINVFCRNLNTNQSTGNYFVPDTRIPQCIRFRSSEPLWITSVGCMPCYQGYQLNATFEIKDIEKNVLVGYFEENSGRVLSRLEQIPVGKPESTTLIRPNTWYSASVTFHSYFNGQLYTSNVDTVSVKTDEGKDVKFEFADDNVAVGLYTGVKQGYIPTLGFKTL